MRAIKFCQHRLEDRVILPISYLLFAALIGVIAILVGSVELARALLARLLRG